MSQMRELSRFFQQTISKKGTECNEFGWGNWKWENYHSHRVRLDIQRNGVSSAQPYGHNSVPYVQSQETVAVAWSQWSRLFSGSVHSFALRGVPYPSWFFDRSLTFGYCLWCISTTWCWTDWDEEGQKCHTVINVSASTRTLGKNDKLLSFKSWRNS